MNDKHDDDEVKIDREVVVNADIDDNALSLSKQNRRQKRTERKRGRIE